MLPRYDHIFLAALRNENDGQICALAEKLVALAEGFATYALFEAFHAGMTFDDE
jgi:F420-0:gamma-glutamyl ligase